MTRNNPGGSDPRPHVRVEFEDGSAVCVPIATLGPGKFEMLFAGESGPDTASRAWVADMLSPTSANVRLDF